MAAIVVQACGRSGGAGRDVGALVRQSNALGSALMNQLYKERGAGSGQ